ncbi:unnamed protein product [Fraxinus pennsylvanica]|uniref:Uncharacterized protein n=1 Tax=Fraxinus pennsylvanica TaxID=56036 RepID=A0AAD2EAR1_9LAMI|nr:unnamed protein product [Fraxinus pennsylvanica]
MNNGRRNSTIVICDQNQVNETDVSRWRHGDSVSAISMQHGDSFPSACYLRVVRRFCHSSEKGTSPSLQMHVFYHNWRNHGKNQLKLSDNEELHVGYYLKNPGFQ